MPENGNLKAVQPVILRRQGMGGFYEKKDFDNIGCCGFAGYSAGAGKMISIALFRRILMAYCKGSMLFVLCDSLVATVWGKVLMKLCKWDSHMFASAPDVWASWDNMCCMKLPSPLG